MNEAELKTRLDVAEKSPKQLAAAVSGLPDAVLRFKPEPDKWCILEILGHLADIETVYALRFRQMLTSERPEMLVVDQNAWTQKFGYVETPPAEMVALYGLNRHANLRLLRRLTPEDWNRTAYHAGLKRDFTIGEMIDRMNTHSANHLEQIERLKKEAVRKPN